MMVLKTSKWYQTVRLVMTRRMSIATLYDLPKSTFHVALSRTLRTMLFVMTSGDLNIDLIQFFSTKVVVLSTNYQAPFAVCRYDSWFLISEGGPKRPPVRYRAFQSPPGIGLKRALTWLIRLALSFTALSFYQSNSIPVKSYNEVYSVFFFAW